MDPEPTQEICMYGRSRYLCFYLPHMNKPARCPSPDTFHVPVKRQRLLRYGKAVNLPHRVILWGDFISGSTQDRDRHVQNVEVANLLADVTKVRCLSLAVCRSEDKANSLVCKLDSLTTEERYLCITRLTTRSMVVTSILRNVFTRDA